MVGAIGALVERYGLRRLHRRGHVSELLFTFGLAFVIEEVVEMVWGKLPVDYRVPPQLDFVAFRLFDTTYPAYRVFMLLVAVGMFAALLALLTRTRVGLIIQAALTHPDMVAMLGHDVPKIFMLVFGARGSRALPASSPVLRWSRSQTWRRCSAPSCSSSSSSAAWVR